MVDGGGVAGLCGDLLACWLAALVAHVGHRVCILLRLQVADLAANECGNKLGRAASGLLGGLARDGRGRISKRWSNSFAAELFEILVASTNVLCGLWLIVDPLDWFKQSSSCRSLHSVSSA